MSAVKDKPKEQKIKGRPFELFTAKITLKRKLSKSVISLRRRRVSNPTALASQHEVCETFQGPETVELGARDSEVFINALFEDREPTEKAKQAAARYLKTLE